ncbi:Arginine N-methyltransferase 2 [Toensbergia leucococca]|nr:Arginine N-methyltransferase 2 [Toensbergia leucococca]
MEIDDLNDPDPDLSAQSIILASSHHNIESLRILLRTGSASVQDPETGFTPLHAAIAACEPSSPIPATQGTLQINGQITNGWNTKNGSSTADQTERNNPDIEAAAETMRLLLQNGAIWNDLDKNDETPGCLALRLGLRDLYEIMVDAGVRAEMLLNRLDGFELLGDGEDEDDDLKKEEEEDLGINIGEAFGIQGQETVHEEVDIVPMQEKETDFVADAQKREAKSEDYLQSDLSFQTDRILDGDNNGVMMAWETDIMKRTAELLAPKPGLRILNIGHGMGIIDNFFQTKSPTSHHIIEAHPAILIRMKQEGWDEKLGMTIHEGKWQEVLPRLIEQGVLFDAIYFDTFAEDYKALREFFSEYMIGLLEEEGKWGFFNGLGADRQICYDVYAKVVEMDVLEAGFDMEWETIGVPHLGDGEWDGVRRKYWVLKEYRLPICEYLR